MNTPPDGLLETLPPGTRLFASKYRAESPFERLPAREKNGFIGWFEFERTGPSYPYRRTKGVWHLDRNMLLYPGGRKQSMNYSGFFGPQLPTPTQAALVTSEAPAGFSLRSEYEMLPQTD